MEQPLYSIAKGIQYTWPETFGEDKFVVVTGGLHIEMNVIKLLSDIPTGSEWITILVQSELTTPVRADTILKGSHVTILRYIYIYIKSQLQVYTCFRYQHFKSTLNLSNLFYIDHRLILMIFLPIIDKKIDCY